METTKYIWMDGKLVEWDKAQTHILTHTLHYGAGAFEGIRAYETERGPAIFRLKEHIDRLFYSAGKIGMAIPFTEKQIVDATIQTVVENEINSCYIRPLAYYGYGKMGVNPTGAPVNVVVACWPWGAYFEGAKSIKVKTSKYIRIHPESTIADAKICGHYVNSILASLEIKQTGCDEALFLDYRGHVAEGPGENIFMVKDGQLFTPQPGSILKGITRDTIITLARDLGITVTEKEMTIEDLLNADELFFTGTAAEVQPIGILDDKMIGNGQVGEITGKLRALYMDIVHGKNENYSSWLTYVK